MKRYKKPINIFKQLKLNSDEYAVYKRDMREYHLKNNTPIRGVKIRKVIYPLASFCVKLSRLASKHSIEVINDKRVASDKPCIFAVTHVGLFDIERVFEACKTSCWIFNGDPETVYRNFDGLGLFLSGVILIDTDSKSDRKVAVKTAVKLLSAGGNLMFFPEGIWNVHPGKPVLYLFPGIIEIAFSSGADIVPVAIEQYDKCFQVNIGRNISVEELKNVSESKEYVLNFLRDIMATLKWEIFENNKDSRKNMENVVLIQQKRIKDRLYEWTDKNGEPHYNENILIRRQYIPKDRINFEDVFSHLGKLKPTVQNAFLFNKRLK